MNNVAILCDGISDCLSLRAFLSIFFDTAKIKKIKFYFFGNKSGFYSHVDFFEKLNIENGMVDLALSHFTYDSVNKVYENIPEVRTFIQTFSLFKGEN